MDENNVGTNGQQTESTAQQPQIVVVQPQTAQQPQQTTPNQSNVGLFNQEQVNAIVSGRVSQLNAKIAELTKTNETLTADIESYKTKYTELEQTSALSAAGIPSNLTDYVKFEVSKLSSNGKSFADNLTEYVKANQSFIDSIKQSSSSGVNGQQNGGQQNTQQSLQSPLLQQLAGNNVTSTNGQGRGAIQNQGLGSLDVDAILAKEGIKRRK